MRTRWLAIGFAGIVGALVAGFQPAVAENGGGQYAGEIRDNDSQQIDRLYRSAVRTAAALGVPVTTDSSPRLATLFQYPLVFNTTAVGFVSEAISNHVDLDPSSGIRDFACGTRTYDGHTGTDIALSPYAWTMMDRKEARVIAAMAGVIVDRHDGEFDRQCTWNSSAVANYVIIRHDNGLLGFYWHLKSGTVITKAVGQRVALGEILGYVGSSGISTGPHLHFEVRNGTNTVLDPYAGQCRTGATRWSAQSRPIDPGVIRVAAHSVAPPSASNCNNPDPYYASRLLPGGRVFGAVYLRDQTPGATAVIAIVRPSGAVASSWTTGSPASGFWQNAYWYMSYDLPVTAELGEWKVRATFQGRNYEQSFMVALTPPINTTVAATVASPTQLVKPGVAANFDVTVTNSGVAKAQGCTLSLTRPINADVYFRQRNPSTGVQGPVNGSFAVPLLGSATARITIIPRAGFTATAAEFPVLVKCSNSAAGAFSRVRTMLTLTRG